MRPAALLIVFAISLIAGFAGTVVAYPYLVMKKASEKILHSGEVSWNAFHHGPRVTETSRGVVRPSPDLIYSVCVYDLSDGPVRITAPAPADGRYASISFYADNTDNYAVFNDRDPVFRGGLDVLLARKAVAGDGLVVESPSEKGVVLLRRIVESDAAFPIIDAERRKARCVSAP